MARADAVLGRIEGDVEFGPAAADLGFGPAEVGVQAMGGHPAAPASEFNRRVWRDTHIIVGAAVIWLLIAWRAVEGY